ncbi:hypothetical protein RJ55_01678 [Drechmeria coniospora]|nr:hypothetical protein RJ55_01678 [Drechmeria coniospora]
MDYSFPDSRSNTTIPIPKVFGSGVADGDFDGLGPYIVMEYVHGLSLDDLILENDEEWALRKDCPAETIEKVYRQIACIYLQLFQHSFPKIGSLSAVDSDGVAPEWRLASGPLTFKMNEVERMGGVRIGASDGPFDQTIDYFQTLVDQSLSHLLHNPHAGRDEQEIQADRHSIDTLGSLARHFSSKGNVENQYRLFCDDLRFGNILVDESYQIVAVLDWEFCYVAPQSFLCSPPSWLIGTEPFEWKDDDVAYFTEKVGLFLSLLGEEEEKRDENDHRLSHLMRDSMRDGTFWFNLAIRESFPLSDIMSHCRNLEAFQNLTLYCGSSSDRKVTDKTPERQKWRAVDNSTKTFMWVEMQMNDNEYWSFRLSAGHNQECHGVMHPLSSTLDDLVTMV